MRAKFIRGEDPKQTIGIGKYSGLPQEVIKAVVLLRDLGYFRKEYEDAFHLRKESDHGINQFFWNNEDDSYTWQGAKLLWNTLFWLPLKTPEEFYNLYQGGGDYYIPDRISFEASLSFGKIDPLSSVARYTGGSIMAHINLKADGRFLGLPKSYEVSGIKNSEELNQFISKKLRDLEIYIKKFLKAKHLQ